MNERRVQRLESTIKAKVAAVLARDMSDPRLGLVVDRLPGAEVGKLGHQHHTQRQRQDQAEEPAPASKG